MERKEKLKEYARNVFYSNNGKLKSKEYFEVNKKRLQIQAGNNCRNFSEKEKGQIQNMERIDIKTWPKNKNKNYENIEKGTATQA